MKMYLISKKKNMTKKGSIKKIFLWVKYMRITYQILIQNRKVFCNKIKILILKSRILAIKHLQEIIIKIIKMKDFKIL